LNHSKSKQKKRQKNQQLKTMYFFGKALNFSFQGAFFQTIYFKRESCRDIENIQGPFIFTSSFYFLDD